jgi:pimeloyl-ACP methyl ester carboxylesterase
MPEANTIVVPTAQASIAVLVEGSGPLVVLLPSLGRGAGDFDAVAAALVGRGYRVARPQPRGIGRSSGPMSGNTLHGLAADIATVIRRLDGAPAIVAGHAFGNKVARTLAADSPELVRMVVILAGAGRAAIPEDVRRSILSSGDLDLPDDERIGHLMKAFFAPGNDPTGWLHGWYPETKAMELEAERATPPDDFIGAGSAPILDVQAADDTVVPVENRMDLKNEVGERVTIVTIEDAGHALLPEQPARVAEMIDAYASGKLSRG